MKIAIGASRKEKKWVNRDIAWEDFIKRAGSTIRTVETVSEYRKLPKNRQDEIKDVGGFVGGQLKEGRRKNGNVLCRSMLTLDMDHAPSGNWNDIISNLPYRTFIYSTHKHTPEEPRLRLIMPLAREVTEDEYPAVARMVANDIGMEYFDDTTYEPSRLMYWPSTSSDGEFIAKSINGPLLDPDQFLAKYHDWKDISEWPMSFRQSEIQKRSLAKQADPLTKDGIVGAFCNVYGIEDAISVFLQDVYEESAIPGRYDYIPADSGAGLVIYNNKFAYSHHATDPAGGKLLNSFDLVRVHRFGNLDEKVTDETSPSKIPSFVAMSEMTIRDNKIKEYFAKERLIKAEQEFEDENWQSRLELTKTGAVKDSFGNFLLILNHDPALSSIAFNQMRDGIDVKGDLPWQRVKPGWAEMDGAKLYEYLQNTYSIYSPSKSNHSVMAAAGKRQYHPIKEYLNNLPPWDGVPRVDTLIIDYFGAEDNIYVREATRKTLAAAVARIFSPGIKFECMLVLNGKTGLGKSTFFDKLAGEWFSDSLTFADMGKGKDAPEKIQGFWIVEIPELTGITKADVNNVKAFLSRKDDNYRASYGHVSESHPRQCIIVGSTNSENLGFLRDVTGNRRFWPIRVGGTNSKKGWDLKDDDVLQIWAEAKLIWENGEKLYVEDEVAEMAERAQMDALETDEREGIVREYLEKLLPETWDQMDIYRRQEYMRCDDDPTQPAGEIRRDAVCNMEIWCECFCKRREDFERQDSHKIISILEKIGGWERADKKKRMGPYGIVPYWVRREARR